MIKIIREFRDGSVLVQMPDGDTKYLTVEQLLETEKEETIS